MSNRELLQILLREADTEHLCKQQSQQWQDQNACTQTHQSDACAVAVVQLEDALRELALGDQPALTWQRQARVITSAQRPYRIQAANQTWTELCGFTSEESIGCTFGIMQGPGTNMKSLKDFAAKLSSGQPTAQLLLNYKKGGEPFLNFVQVVHAAFAVTSFTYVTSSIYLRRTISMCYIFLSFPPLFFLVLTFPQFSRPHTLLA